MRRARLHERLVQAEVGAGSRHDASGVERYERRADQQAHNTPGLKPQTAASEIREVVAYAAGIRRPVSLFLFDGRGSDLDFLLASLTQHVELRLGGHHPALQPVKALLGRAF